MPYHDPEPDDPHMLVGVGLPAGPEAQRAMARTFAEEFARMGFDLERILTLFQQPFYAGAHRALVVLGADEIGRLVTESVGLWGRSRVAVRDAVPPLWQPEESRKGDPACPP